MIAQTLFWLPILLVSVVLHEVSHGWVALWFGDTTARDAGRLTLNPLRHIDPFGSVVLPLLLAVSGAPFLFACAKPVPVNPFRLSRPKRDMIFVGAAGVTMNFILAFAAAVILGGLRPVSPVWVHGLSIFIVFNIVLGVFNLFPIPPLDGSRVLAGLLPVRPAAALLRLERYGMWILFGLIFLGFFRAVMLPIVELFLSVLVRLTGAELAF